MFFSLSACESFISLNYRTRKEQRNESVKENKNLHFHTVVSQK